MEARGLQGLRMEFLEGTRWWDSAEPEVRRVSEDDICPI